MPHLAVIAIPIGLHDGEHDVTSRLKVWGINSSLFRLPVQEGIATFLNDYIYASLYATSVLSADSDPYIAHGNLHEINALKCHTKIHCA